MDRCGLGKRRCCNKLRLLAIEGRPASESPMLFGDLPFAGRISRAS